MIYSFNIFLASTNSVPDFLDTGDSVVNKTDQVPVLTEIIF